MAWNDVQTPSFVVNKIENWTLREIPTKWFKITT